MKIKIGSCLLKLSILPAIVYLSLMILLVFLGNWQLSRSEEKTALLAQQEQSANAPSVKLDLDREDVIANMRYRPVEAKGRFDTEHQFLLDNQIRHGKPGYFVMTPLMPEGSSQAVLINRGWVALNIDRKVLPDISLQEQQVEVRGRVNQFPGIGLKLPGAEIPTDTWPAVVQVIDSAVLSEKLGYPLAPFQIELDQNSNHGYLREWTINTTIPPEKHVAYAMQWFGLALALTVLFFWYACKTE
ncbi:MAG: SURF1 family protein [Gammaproteobacteria bacterium]